MGARSLDLPELRDLGLNLARSRLDRGLSQSTVAQASNLSQAQVSLFESGQRLPSLDQFVRLARVLDVPLQNLLTGADRPGTRLPDIAVELRRLGAVDLWVADASVPGSARRPEEVIALAVSGSSPDPRVIEALPALLSWNEISAPLLRAYGITTRTIYRLAWLVDVALAIERQKGFPGGCRKGPLERFLKGIEPPKKSVWDDLGRPTDGPPKYPAWKRWKIGYAATPDQFERRARTLIEASPSSFKLKITRRRSGRLSVSRVPRGRPRTTGSKTLPGRDRKSR